MTIGDSDYNILKNSLHLQLKLIQDKMAQMQLVKNAIEDTIKTIDKDKYDRLEQYAISYSSYQYGKQLKDTVSECRKYIGEN